MRNVQAKITVKFLFAATQILIALSILIVAVLLNFNLLNTRLSLNIPNQALNFYVVMLTVFGVTFLISGFLIIYEWWEKR